MQQCFDGMSLNIRLKICYEHALQFRQSLQIRQQHPRGVIELNCPLSKSPMSRFQSSNDAYYAKERVGHMCIKIERGVRHAPVKVYGIRESTVLVEPNLDSWIRNWIPTDSVRDSKRVGPLPIVNGEISIFVKK